MRQTIRHIDQLKKSTPFLVVIALFLGINAHDLFTEGMFLDGLTYASISRNLAMDYSGIWNLSYTDSIAQEFYGHLPLAIWLQAGLFYLFGDHLVIERIYSLVTYLISGYLICLHWKEYTNSIKWSWVALLFWISVPEVNWGVANNMLENTMTVWLLFSTLFHLKYEKSGKLKYLLVSFAGVILAILSKGVTACFILLFPLLLQLGRSQKSIRQGFRDMIMVSSGVLVFFLLLYIISGDASTYLKGYVNQQVIPGILSEQTVDFRWSIIGSFLKNLIIPGVLLIFVLVLFRFFFPNFGGAIVHRSAIRAYLSLAVVGVFPILVTLKQSSFYILSVYPFVGLACGLIILPYLKRIKSPMNVTSSNSSVLLIASTLLLIISIIWNYKMVGQVHRDTDLVQLARSMRQMPELPTKVALHPTLSDDWALHAYLARYAGVSLVTQPSQELQWRITCLDCTSVSESDTFRKISFGKYRMIEIVQPK